ncbi:MAG: helix-turn-helix domain-containing protein [Candidatus Fimenecus sp.]
MSDKELYNSPKVANTIKSFSKSKKIALKDILIACDLGSNTFSHMLHGKSIAFDSLAKIADYLDVSVDYLLGRTDNPEVNK